MDEVIRRLEAATETGSNLLDTILTSKNLRCMQKGIAMTCFADGHELDFMDVMDVCTIFGNALDNAIECEEKIEDVSKRLIKSTSTPSIPLWRSALKITARCLCPSMATLRRQASLISATTGTGSKVFAALSASMAAM